MTSPVASCTRCGYRRNVHKSRRIADLCFDCSRFRERDYNDAALSDGHWSKGPAGLRVWVSHVCHCGQPLVGQSCETCIRWAEKDAHLHAERAQSWANRHVIWGVLAVRKEREEAA